MEENQNTANNNSNQVNENQKQLESCKIELQQVKDNFLRLNADFENYKRRVLKEKSEWMNTAQSEIFAELLNIVDDFDRAFEESKKINPEQSLNSWIKGFELIHKSLYKLLEKYGIKEIKDFSSFNPEIHEAIAQSESNKKAGEIINIAQKGYLFKDKILRPAKVIVAK